MVCDRVTVVGVGFAVGVKLSSGGDSAWWSCGVEGCHGGVRESREINLKNGSHRRGTPVRAWRGAWAAVQAGAVKSKTEVSLDLTHIFYERPPTDGGD